MNSRTNPAEEEPGTEPTPVKPALTKLVMPERKRTYHYADGKSISFDNIAAFGVSPSGHTHRLEAVDGRKFIVPLGDKEGSDPRFRVVAIEIDTDEWTL